MAYFSTEIRAFAQSIGKDNFLVVGEVAGSAALALLPASAYAPNAAASVLSSPVRNFVGALDWLAYVWPVLALAYLGWQLAAYNEGVPQDSGATR